MKTSILSFIIYDELGRYPIEIDIKIRMISYWAKFVDGKQSKLSNVIYNISPLPSNTQRNNFVWLTFVKNIFNVCGYTYIWDTHTPNLAWLRLNIKQELQDQFIQSWFSNIEHSGKALNYRLFKNQFETENYLYSLDDNFLYEFCRFRTLNHKLPMESGRWQNIDRNMRTCNLCDKKEIGDEFHYILECNYFNNIRKKIY